MLARQLAGLRPSLVLAQTARHLVFREPATLHRPSSVRRRTLATWRNSVAGQMSDASRFTRNGRANLRRHRRQEPRQSARHAFQRRRRQARRDRLQRRGQSASRSAARWSTTPNGRRSRRASIPASPRAAAISSAGRIRTPALMRYTAEPWRCRWSIIRACRKRPSR